MADLHHQSIHKQQLSSSTADLYLALLIDHECKEHQQKKLSRLHKAATIDERTIADAIFYRIVNPTHKIDLNGDSLRELKLKTEQN